MVVAEQGCIIVEDKGTLMKYKKKCEKCGYVETGGGTLTTAPRQFQKRTTSFKCPKCKNMQKVVIGGA